MAVKRTTTTLNQVITLRGPRGKQLIAVNPKGVELRFPAEHGRVQLHANEPGTWTYRWGDGGPEGLIEVIVPKPLNPVRPPGRVEFK